MQATQRPPGGHEMQLAIQGGIPVRTRPFPRWPDYGEGEKNSLLEVLRSGSWGGYNKKLEEFEAAFAALHGVRYAISCGNGTVALEVALRSLGIRCGDEVIVPAITFIATASTVLLCHGVPVFADIDPTTLNLSPEAAEAAITPRTRAIVVVHFGGHPADMDRFPEIARRHGLALVEDAAHAHGAAWRDILVGNFGDAATFSFQAFKLVTSGEGGMILTNSAALAEKAWAYCNHGRHKSGGWFEHFSLGTNYRMTGFQAALLGEQLAKHPAQSKIRQENAAHLRDLLRSFSGLHIADPDPRVTSHPQYLVNLRYDPREFSGLSRDGFIRALAAEGIPAEPAYPHPLYRNPLFQRKNFPPCGCGAWHSPQDYESLRLPESERICQEGIWFPHYLFLGTPQDVEDIVEACDKVRKLAYRLGSRFGPEGSAGVR